MLRLLRNWPFLLGRISFTRVDRILPILARFRAVSGGFSCSARRFVLGGLQSFPSSRISSHETPPDPHVPSRIPSTLTQSLVPVEESPF